MKTSNNNVLVKSLAILVASLLLGVAFDYFFFADFPGVGFPIYVLLMIIAMLSLARYFKKPLNRQIIWLQVPLAFFSLMVFIRSSDFLSLLNALTSLLLLFLIARLSTGDRLKKFSLKSYAATIFLPVEFIRPFFKTMSGLFTGIQNKSDREVTKHVAKGLAITIPMVFILAALLSSGDAVFNKFVSGFLSFNISDETVTRFVIVAIVTALFTGAYTYILAASQPERAEEPAGRLRKLGQIEAGILLGSISFLFLLFIILQIAYLFGGQGNISSQGFTYAEYARRGFFELIAVAAISFLTVWLTERFITTTEKGHALLFKALSGGLVVEVMVIIASAFRRLWLYEEAYGFTELRLYSHIFVVLIAVLFALLFYKIIRNKSESTFLFQTLLTAIVFLAVINILNPDATIARLNVDRYHKTDKIDVSYLSSLSDDSSPILVGALPLKDKALNQDLSRQLLLRLQKREASPGYSRWQSFNLSHDASDKLLKDKEVTLKKESD
jgi:hypothetical protein